jgi:hypothetical protein
MEVILKSFSFRKLKFVILTLLRVFILLTDSETSWKFSFERNPALKPRLSIFVSLLARCSKNFNREVLQGEEKFISKDFRLRSLFTSLKSRDELTSSSEDCRIRELRALILLNG